MDDNFKNGEMNYSVKKISDLQFMRYMLLKRWKIILSFIVLYIMISIIYIYCIATPMYSASTMLFVYRSNDSSSALYNEITAGAQLVNDVAVVLKSEPVAEKTLNRLNNPGGLTTQQIIQKINASVEKNTRLLKIRVTDKDPYKAATIANTITKVLVERFDEIMKSKVNPDEEYISIVEDARPDTSPISPQKKLIIMTAFILGLFSGFGVVFVLDYLDNTIKSTEEAEWYMGTRVIAVVPEFRR